MVGFFLLTVDDVLEIHDDQIVRYGGTAGVRDMGLLESAVAAPTASFEGQLLHRDAAEIAGAYLFHIARNHAFLDGNKRVATASALVFLHLNGYAVQCQADALTAAVVAVATGNWSRESITNFLRQYMVPHAP